VAVARSHLVNDEQVAFSATLNGAIMCNVNAVIFSIMEDKKMEQSWH
jgi:hypothetical protein